MLHALDLMLQICTVRRAEYYQYVDIDLIVLDYLGKMHCRDYTSLQSDLELFLFKYMPCKTSQGSHKARAPSTT